MECGVDFVVVRPLHVTQSAGLRGYVDRLQMESGSWLIVPHGILWELRRRAWEPVEQLFYNQITSQREEKFKENLKNCESKR